MLKSWIESHSNLLNHPKLIALASDLNCPRHEVIGFLHCLWHNALIYKEDGDIREWGDNVIAEMAHFSLAKASKKHKNVPKSIRVFVDCLRKHGFIDNGLLHDWPDYAGKYLISKYSNSNQQLLIDIYARHGRIYGRLPPADASALPPVQTKSESIPENSKNSSGGLDRTGLRSKPGLDKPPIPRSTANINKTSKKKDSNTIKDIKNDKVIKYDKINPKLLYKIIMEYARLKGWQLDTSAVRNSIMRRNAKTSKELYEIAYYDIEMCIRAMGWTKSFCKQRGLDWSLETVIKMFPEFNKPKKNVVRYE